MNRILTLLSAGIALAGLAMAGGPAQAAPLTISLLDPAAVVPQSASAPCIICGTNQAHNPATWGFNDFTNTGNLTSFNTFSTNINPGSGGQVAGDLEANAVAYTGSLLELFLNAGGTDPLFHFGVVIDVNTAHNGETLNAFSLLDLSKPIGQKVVFDLPIPVGGIALPVAQQGNGHADYLISGFDLSLGCRSSGQFVLSDCVIQPGDNLLFHAAWSGASDGAESFYVVVVPTVNPPSVPEPTSLVLLGTGIVGMIGLVGWKRRTR